MKLIKSLSNEKKSVFIYQNDKGEVYSSDGKFFSNINDLNFKNDLDLFIQGCVNEGMKYDGLQIQRM